ncbi:LamG domain-containing protein [bacterium]|nr:LamG domain-containing protein [bacterium]
MIKTALSIIFVTILTSIFATQCLFAGSLVAYWSFDEGSGKTLKDQSGTGNDGEINGAKWVDGKYNKAMEFNGSDEFVLVPNDDSYNFGKDDSFSISLWINYEPKGDWQGPLQKFNGGYPFKVEVEPDNDLYFAIYDGSAFPKAFVGNISGKWHHCCFLRDVETDKVYSYLDGELKEANNDDTTAEISNAADLYIGARKPGNTIGYQGMLDEIAIYNRVLTEDEIKQAANGKLPEVSTAVAPSDKLTTTWGHVKGNY